MCQLELTTIEKYKKKKVREINFADFPTLTQTLQNYTIEPIADL